MARDDARRRREETRRRDDVVTDARAGADADDTTVTARMSWTGRAMRDSGRSAALVGASDESTRASDSRLARATSAMVLYYTPRGAETTGHVIYVGADKHENEHLIKWGLPHDVWFHVDKLSSAHVYLRMSPGQTMDDITPEELEDCAQLVKANSIAGNKQNDLYVVYTPWENLLKRGDMDVGQVAFKSDKAVGRTKVKTRINDIVNRLNKTKVERFPDLQAEREAYDEGVRREKKEAYRVAERERLEEERAREADREARDYKHMMVEDSMKSNKEMAKKYASVEEAEDDFM